jgi:hypothetical protein
MGPVLVVAAAFLAAPRVDGAVGRLPGSVTVRRRIPQPFLRRKG